MIILHLQNDHLGHWTASILDELAPHLEAVAVCSEYLRSTFAAKSPALAAKTKIVHNGVNTHLFFPREELREPGTGPRPSKPVVIQGSRVVRIAQLPEDSSIAIS